MQKLEVELNFYKKSFYSFTAFRRNFIIELFARLACHNMKYIAIILNE